MQTSILIVLLRSLQRRVKQWKALSGPEKEVMFRPET